MPHRIVKTIQKYLASLHPLIKIMVYAQLLCVAIWGPLPGVIITAVVCFVLLAFYPDDRGAIANPYFALLFCLLAVLIVLPGGSRDEILYASRLSTRLLDVMLVSAMLGTVISPVDLARIGNLLHLPNAAIMVIVAVASFLPLSLRNIHTVIVAQRSRGFEFKFLSLFRPTTYRVLVVPYVVCILRSALDKWVSMNLRPWVGYRRAMPKISIQEIGLLFISSLLWFV
jgi:energy-coupling factor transporter transmembrane protein EcfT